MGKQITSFRRRQRVFRRLGLTSFNRSIFIIYYCNNFYASVTTIGADIVIKSSQTVLKKLDIIDIPFSTEPIQTPADFNYLETIINAGINLKGLELTPTLS